MSFDPRRYLGLFLSEAREHLEHSLQLAAGLHDGSADEDTVRELFRHAHSMKGMAATMGYVQLVRIAHALEDLLAQAATTPAVGVDAAAAVSEALDCMTAMIGSVERGGPATHPRATQVIDRLRVDHPGTPPTGNPPGAAPPGERPPVPRCRLDIELDPRTAPLPAASAALLLGRLGEIGRIARVAPPMFDVRSGIFAGRLEVTLETARPREEVEREIEGLPEVRGVSWIDDPAEALSESHAPAPAWTRVRADLLDSLLECTIDLILERGRLVAALGGKPVKGRRSLERCAVLLKRLYGDVTELRLVPFESLLERLRASVGEVATRLGKTVSLAIEGGHLRLDRSVLERLVEPLMHVLRNAVDHGIENGDERARAGKPLEGRIVLRLEREADRVRLTVADDGRGIDVDRLRRAAVDLGVLTPAEALAIDDDEARRLITFPGLSTAAAASEISGRGMGMDVVRHDVEILGGDLTVAAGRPHGTEIRLSFPMSLAMIQALLVRSAGSLYAVPVASVQRAVDIRGREVEVRAGRRFVRDVEPIELVLLSERLGQASGETGDWALVLAEENATRALVVDDVLERRDVVVRPLEPPLQGLREYAGAALLEDGSMALVLNPVGLTGSTRA